MELNQVKLQDWARRIHQNACEHGWHDEKKSHAHWLCMVITEIAEAVEADRKNRRFTEESKSEYELRLDACDRNNQAQVTAYELCVKGTLEEEFADIVIRILDYAYEVYGDSMVWASMPTNKIKSLTFTESAFSLIRFVTDKDYSVVGISLLVIFMYDWAEAMGIDLDYHIEAKMKYNECRQYRHGGKKY